MCPVPDAFDDLGAVHSKSIERPDNRLVIFYTDNPVENTHRSTKNQHSEVAKSVRIFPLCQK